MYVIGHDDCGMEVDSLPVVMQAMRENEIAGGVGEEIADELTEGHEDGTARLLVMRQSPPILVFAAEGGKFGHDLLQAKTMPLSVTPEH